MGRPTHGLWSFKLCEQSQVAEDEDDAEEEEVGGHAHKRWQEREVEQ